MTLSYNPRQKSLRQYCNIHIFLSFLGSLLKQCILFEIFLQFSLPQPYTELKLGKNSGCTRPTLFVGWGEGLDLCELENAPETQKCPKTFVHDFTCSVIRELKATVKQTTNTCNFAAKRVEEQWRTFHHTCSNLSYNCCKTHEYDFWLDKITRKSRQTRGLQHFLKNKFALGR